MDTQYLLQLFIFLLFIITFLHKYKTSAQRFWGLVEWLAFVVVCVVFLAGMIGFSMLSQMTQNIILSVTIIGLLVMLMKFFFLSRKTSESPSKNVF